MAPSAHQIILGIFFLASLTQNATIDCENNPISWKWGKRLELSDREMIVSTIYDKVDVIIDSKDGLVSASIKNRGAWEPRNLRAMAQFVKEGDTILNIGSHIGLEAIVMGHIAGPKGRLFIFQPYSLTYNMVLKNVYLNELGDMATVYNVGASDHHSKGYISVSIGNTGGSQIFTNKSIAKSLAQTEQVQVDRVDNVLPPDAVINFALIDVQRLQVQCLQGMKATIERSPDMVIMCEWSGLSNNSQDLARKKEDLLKWFSSLNFKFYRLGGGQTGLCQVESFRELNLDEVLSIQGTDNFIDIFFVPSHIDIYREP